MKLEGPKLGIKTSKSSPASWATRGVREEDLILSLYMEDGEMFPVVAHFWQGLKENEITLNLPDSVYDFVIINEVLECYDLEHRRKLLKECKRVTKNGGLVIAISKCCHDGEELYELVKNTDLDIDKFYNRRLSNQSVANLAPDNAVFFNQVIVSPSRKRLLQIMKDFGIEGLTLEKMWSFPEKLAVNRFHAGLKWGVQR